MFEQQLPAHPPSIVGPENKIEHLIARVPALDVPIEVPTIEQVQATDEVFQHTHSDADNIVGMLGMVGGMMLLHDVAVDTLHDVRDLEGHMLREKRKTEDEDEDDEE